jgi:protein-disulfide isomerase
MTRLALGLIAGLATVPAFAEDKPAAMSDAERQALRDEIRAYLLENPEVLVEAMDILQAREDEAALLRDVQMVSTHNDRIFNNPNDWVGGNPNGDITLVEFMDYRCGYCRKAYEEVEKLIEADGNIRFVVKEFPILGEASLVSAQFAIAVRQLHGDEAYAKVHDALMTLRGEPTAETLERLAGDLGLEAQPILDRMDAPEVMQVIQDNHQLATEMEINGTPAFVLDDMVMRGYAPLDVMQDFVAEARS